MKLYLSSYRVPHPEKLFALIGKVPDRATGAIITNAKDRKAPEQREEKLLLLETFLSSIGLNKTVRINLYNDQFDLADYDYIYVVGGNTFDLRRAMLETGFDEKLRRYLDYGGVYVGESAGAIVVGPSLRGFEIMDEAPNDALWKGLGIIDTILVPHNDSKEEKFRDRAPGIKERNVGKSVQPLNDDEDYIVS